MLILFDAAGTLIETAEPVEEVYRRIFANHGMEADPESLRRAFLEAYAGLPEPDFAIPGGGDLAERQWWRRLVELTARATGHHRAPGLRECFGELFAHYASASAWRLFPEVPALLAELRQSGHRLAVVSNFDRRLHPVLRDLGVAGHFELILTSADVGARKPSPALLNGAMDRLGEGKETSCLVGDSRREDGGAATAAGIPAMILDRPETTLSAVPSWLAAQFRGIFP